MGAAKRFFGVNQGKENRLSRGQARQTNTLRSQNITPRSQIRSPPTNASLSTIGGTMFGSIGFIADTVDIATGVLDLTANAASDIIKVRKYINVEPETGTADTIDLISTGGTEFPQQELVLIGQTGDTITLTNDSGSASGNNKAILCPGGVNYTLDGSDAVALFYDFALSKWRIIGDANTGGGGGAGFPLSYTVDDQGNSSGTVTHDLNNINGHKLQFIATAACDITISNIPASNAMDFYIEVTQDSTGGWAITANDSEWVQFPTLSTVPDTTSLIACHADGDGNIRAVLLLNSSTTSGAGGASKALDNLALVAINADLLFDTDNTYDIGAIGAEVKDIFIDGIANIDTLKADALGAAMDVGNFALSNMGDITYSATGFSIGGTTNPVDDLFVEQLRFQTGTITANKPMITSVGGTSMDINHPTGSGINFSENGATAAVIIDGGGLITSNNLTLQNILTFNDNTGDPSSNGQFARNSTDVKVYSGGAVRNLSNVSTTTPATTELDNLGTTAINADLLFDAATYDIGDATNRLDNLNVNTIRLRTSTGVANIPSIYSTATTVLDLNIPSGGTMVMTENGVSKHTWTDTTYTAPNAIISNTLTFSDNTGFPSLTGQFARNDTITSLYAPIHEVKNETTVSSGKAAFHLVKVDSTPLVSENVGEINFIVRDTGVETTYASFAGFTNSDTGTVTDAGALTIGVRSDGAEKTAVTIIGNDNSVKHEWLFSAESRIQPVTGNMAYFTAAQVTDFSLNIGTEGTMQIPFFNDGSPSLTDLNSAFGAFDGAIGVDVADDKLYVRTGSSTWAFYSASGTVVP